VTNDVQWLDAMLTIAEPRRPCISLRPKRFSSPRVDNLVNPAFHHLRIEIVDHPLRRIRICQILLAIHVSNKSSHTNTRGARARAPRLLHLYMTDQGVSLQRSSLESKGYLDIAQRGLRSFTQFC